MFQWLLLENAMSLSLKYSEDLEGKCFDFNFRILIFTCNIPVYRNFKWLKFYISQIQIFVFFLTVFRDDSRGFLNSFMKKTLINFHKCIDLRNYNLNVISK